MHNNLTLKRQGYLLTNKYIHYICADKINAMIKTNLFLLLFVLLAGLRAIDSNISFRTIRSAPKWRMTSGQKAGRSAGRKPFSVFNQKMTSDEKEALTFLYAYMPIGDITDYDGQLYLDNIRSSFSCTGGNALGRQHTGRHLPPFRTSRAGQQRESGREPHGLYEELKDRVKGCPCMTPCWK